MASEEGSSQGELLLYTPQGLGALLHLLLLFGLQGHVNHICQATVAQDTRDAQEHLILHSMHALSEEGVKKVLIHDIQRMFSMWMQSDELYDIGFGQSFYLDQC